MKNAGLWIGVLALSLSSGCGGRPPRAERAEPEVTACADPDVTLSFAWPDGLSAAVVGHDFTQSENADGSHPMVGDSWADLRLEVAAEGAGRVIRFLPEGRTRMRSQGLAPDLGGARPIIHVDATGRVVRVDGAAEMRAVVTAAAAQGEISTEDAAMLMENATDEVQVGTARAHWEWLLAAWHGRTMRCGVPERMRVAVPSLSFGRVGIDTETELTYAGRAECGTDAVGSDGCVRLEVRQRDVGDSAARALSSAMGPGVGGAFQRNVAIVVEPGSLVPHTVLFEEHWELRRGGMSRFIRDVQEYTFDYRARRDARMPTGFVVRREGAPPRPSTPLCQWVEACCGQATTNLTAQLVCATIPEDGATDCTREEVDGLRSIVLAMGDGVPPACLDPIPGP